MIVGSRKDSQTYVSMKRMACAEVGIKSFDVDLPEQVSQDELIGKVHELNANPDVHGLYVCVCVYARALFGRFVCTIFPRDENIFKTQVCFEMNFII